MTSPASNESFVDGSGRDAPSPVHKRRAAVVGTGLIGGSIGLALRAFLRLEHHFYTTGVGWYEAKARIIRGAVRAYIAHPMYNLP